MKVLRDLGLVLMAFTILVAFTIWGAGRGRTASGDVIGSAHSAADSGTLALQSWLRSLGYRADNIEYTQWRVPPQAHALLMIVATQEPMTQAEATTTLQWVQTGGLLVAVEEQATSLAHHNEIWKAVGASVVGPQAAQAPATAAVPEQPVLTDPPVASVAVSTANIIETNDSAGSSEGWVTLLESQYGPVFVGRQYGRGYIILGVSSVPFTNKGIRLSGSSSLILNVIRRVPTNGIILFDEYHHGLKQPPSTGSLLVASWWGWSILYTLLVLVLFIILTGQRFGRPLAVRPEAARRSSAEYVVSMAALLRRSGKRRDVAAHYHTLLKRRLAHAYGFALAGNDDDFLRDIHQWGGLTDEQQHRLTAILQGLQRPRISEQELLHWSHAAQSFVDQRGRVA